MSSIYFRSGFKLLFSSFFLAVFVVFCGGQAVSDNQTPKLKLGVPVEGSFASGETQTFALHLESNQLAEIILRRKGIDADIALDDAKDGKRLLEFEINNGIFARDRVLFAGGDQPRDVLIRITSYDKKYAADDKFSLALVALKTVDARDKLRLEAQRVILEGLEFFEEDTKETKEKGRVLFENALKIARQSDDKMLQADALSCLQFSFSWKGDMLKSLEFGSAALALLDEQEEFNKAQIETAIGFSLIASGEAKKGIEVLTENLDYLHKVGDSSSEMFVLTTLSTGYQRLSETAKAVEYAERAFRLAKNIGDDSTQIESLRGISRIYYERGDFDKAIKVLNEALAISKKDADLRSYTSGIYSALALNFNSLGQLQKTLENYQQALDVVRQINGNKYDEAIISLNISDVYVQLGQNTRALEYNRQAVQILDKLGYKDATMSALRGKATIYAALKDFAKAKAAYDELIKIAEQDGVGNQKTIAYMAAGNLEYRLNHYDAAINYYGKVAQISADAKLKRIELNALAGLSNVYLALGQFEKADEYAARTLEISRAIGDRRAESNALYNLACVRRNQKDLTAALRLVEDSLKIVESIRSELIGRESRTAFLSTARHKYEFYISLLIEMQNQPENKKFGELAFAASERARARGLLDLLAESDTDVFAGISPQLKERERAVKAKLSALQTQLIQLKSAEKQDEKRIGELQENIRVADDEREQSESEIRRSNPRYAELKYPTTIDLAQTQAMLDDKTVLLEYQIGADASYLFAVGKNEFQIARLPNGKTLREAVETLHRSISTPARTGLANYLVAGRELYQTLVAPIENLLETKTKIIVAADGALNYLPFETLLRNNQAASLGKLPYLVRDFEISYTPSASVLATLKSYENAAAKPPKTFLAFAAPDYGTKTANQNQLVAQNTRSVFGENRAWKLTDLQFAKTEAIRIAKLFPAGQATVFTGADATEERVKTTDLLTQYRYLHFAVHGLIDEEQPQFSSLVLSLPKSGDQSKIQNPKSKIQNPKSKIEEDGLLQTPEIFNLRLRADLVTLSACETGLGQEMRGEGIVGLTRAFFYAGTPSVLVSLWKVDDASTAELMTHFYENLQKTNGRDKAAALRETQLKLITENRYSHPYYWASFVLQGKPNSNF